LEVFAYAQLLLIKGAKEEIVYTEVQTMVNTNKELITKSTSGKKDIINVRNLPSDQTIVLTKDWDGPVKREKKTGQYGDYVSCHGSIKHNGTTYWCYMPEVVADALDTLKVGESIEVKKVLAENASGKPVKSFKVKRVDTPSSSSLSSTPNNPQPIKFPVNIKVTDREVQFMDMFMELDDMSVRELARENLTCFKAYYKHCNAGDKTDDEICLLHQHFKDIMAIRGYQ